jgi:hypothetical protein
MTANAIAVHFKIFPGSCFFMASAHAPSNEGQQFRFRQGFPALIFYNERRHGFLQASDVASQVSSFNLKDEELET